MVHKILCRRFQTFMITQAFSARCFSCTANADTERQYGEKKLKMENLSDYERLIYAVAPLQRKPYKEQLEMKYLFAQHDLKKLGNYIKNNMKGPPERFIERLKQFDGLPCQLEDVIPSPVVEGYRNKDYYAVGPGTDGKPCVGFYIPPGRRVQDMSISNHIDIKCQNRTHYEIAMEFQEFVQQSSYASRGLNISTGPHWRNLLVRSNRDGHVLVAVVFNHFLATEADRIHAFESAQKLFHMKGLCNKYNIQALYYQECSKMVCKNGQSPYILTYGHPYIKETFNNYEFQIDASSFFQVNTHAAEKLYKIVLDLCGLHKQCVLLDVCCGAGIYSILSSDLVSQAIGLEVWPEAVQNARYNADLNGVQNVTFVCGRAERKLPQITNYVPPNTEVIAVVNPSRGGLGEKVVRAIRSCEAIRRVVYVSCKPSGRSLFNFIGLCQSPEGKIDGEPFLLKRAIPLDMFPHTRHFELILQFER